MITMVKPSITHSSCFPQCSKTAVTMAGTNKPFCTASGVSSNVTLASPFVILPTSSGAEVAVKSYYGSKCQSSPMIVQLNEAYAYCTVSRSPNVSLSINFHSSITKKGVFSTS